MANAPAFQFYANDFMDATRLWDANAVGLYMRCMCIQWTHGSIPADRKLLARAIHCDRDELESCWPTVGPKFEDQGDGTLKNSRLEQVRDRQKTVSEGRTKAANARWEAYPKADANAMQTHMQRKVKVKEKVEREEDTQGRKERAGDPPPELVWPRWAGPNTRVKWEEFKSYKLEEHKDRYASIKSEQRAVNLLAKHFKSGQECVDALDEAMGRKWMFPVDPTKRRDAPKPDTVILNANAKPQDLKPWVN